MILTRKYNFDVVLGGPPLLIRASRKDTSSTLVFSLFAGKGVLDVPVGATAIIRGKAIAPATFSLTEGVPTVPNERYVLNELWRNMKCCACLES